MAHRPAALRLSLERYATVLLSAWLLVVALAVIAVHPTFAAWSGTQEQLREALESHVPTDGVLITNIRATRKFVPELERRFPVIPTERAGPADVRTLLARHGVVYLALLDRSDSSWWRAQATENAAFLASLEVPREQLTRVSPTNTDDLRIWRLTPAAPGSDKSPQPSSER
jgi:hypothetical protein